MMSCREMPAMTGGSSTPDDKSNSASDPIQQKTSDAIIDSLDHVFLKRRGYFAQHPDKRPTKGSAGSLTESYSANNSVISGGLNLLPGPCPRVQERVHSLLFVSTSHRELTARARPVTARRLWRFEMNGDFPIPTVAILWRVDE